MTIFDDQSGNQEDTSTNPLDKYVGEGKKYATVADLIKGFENGQSHIQTIEDENRQFREGIHENILNAQQHRQSTPPSNQEQQTPGNDQRLNEQDLVERIREVTRAEREREQADKNINTVTDRLVETFGSEEAARDKLKARAQELGVSTKFLMDVAVKSPAAFYAQMNLDATPRQVPGPRGDVNPMALQAQTQGTQAKPGTYAFYEEMRKTNPRLYKSPKVQLEMHNQALQNPEAFFGTQ